MNAAPDDLAHFLGNDACHCVDRLKECAQALGEIRNSNTIARAQKHHHGLANDATESKQNGGDNSGQRRGNNHARDGGRAIKYGGTQIAVFRFATRGEWYACQNMCPHRREFVLAQGILGDVQGTPKVACPVHKKTFALTDGQCLSGEDYSVEVFPVKVEGAEVYVELRPPEKKDAVLATTKTCNRGCDLHPV